MHSLAITRGSSTLAFQFSIVNKWDYQHLIDESDPENVAMANHLVDAWLGCFIHPIYGTPDGQDIFVHDYPTSMRSGPYKLKYIPEFTAAEKELLGTARSALTAIGLNHYGTFMVDAVGNISSVGKTKMFDSKVPLSYSFQARRRQEVKPSVPSPAACR